MDAEHPFLGYKLYKVFHKNEGRWYAQLVPKKGYKLKRTTVSFARYLMSVKLQKLLDPKQESVDHIDGNKENDAIDNLMVVPISLNIKRYFSTHAKRKTLELICYMCKKNFTVAANSGNVYTAIKTGKPLTELCCSKQCGYLKNKIIKSKI